MSQAGKVTRRGRRRIVIGLATMAVATGVVLWSAGSFFAQNNVEFLLNQQDYPAALEKLEKLKSSRSDAGRLAALETQALVLTGDVSGAISAANPADGWPPEGWYWLAVAQFQAGETTSGQSSAARFLRSGEELPNGAGAIAKALAGEQNLSEPPDLDGLPFRMMFPLEQAIYLAFVAGHRADLGNFDLAARLYREALIRGLRNRQALENAAFVSALTGDLGGAGLFAGLAGVESLARIATKLDARRGQTGMPRLSLQGDDMVPGGRQIDVDRGLAWALAEIASGGSEVAERTSATLAELSAQHPDDASIRFSRLKALAAAGQSEQARQLYEQLQATNPAYETWLWYNGGAAGAGAGKGAALSAEELTSQSLELLGRLTPVKVLTGVALRRGLLEEAPGRAEMGCIEAEVSVEEPGSYGISLIARNGAAAANKAAAATGLMSVLVDGEVAGMCDFSDSYWKLCTVKTALEPGEHLVQIAPADGPGELPEVAIIVVTQPGAALR